MKNKGISLVVLVITIIVLIILTASVVMLAGGENGIISRAQNAVFASNLSNYQEELVLNVSNKALEALDRGETLDQSRIYASWDESGTQTDIKYWLPDITEDYGINLCIIKGKLTSCFANKAKQETAKGANIQVIEDTFDLTDYIYKETATEIMLLHYEGDSEVVYIPASYNGKWIEVPYNYCTNIGDYLGYSGNIMVFAYSNAKEVIFEEGVTAENIGSGTCEMFESSHVSKIVIYGTIVGLNCTGIDTLEPYSLFDSDVTIVVPANSQTYTTYHNSLVGMGATNDILEGYNGSLGTIRLETF